MITFISGAMGGIIIMSYVITKIPASVEYIKKSYLKLEKKAINIIKAVEKEAIKNETVKDN